MNVFLLTPQKEAAYQEYVMTHDNSTIFHTLGWKKVLEETYGYKALYSVLEEENRIVGVCPAFLVKTIKGKGIVSQPFAEYGYPLVDKTEDVQQFFDFYHSFDVDFVEFRESPFYPISYKNKKLNGYLYYLDIEGKDFERDIWNNLYSNKIRNLVRNARKKGVVVSVSDDIDTYYSLYLSSMKRLGSPPHAKKLFENIRTHIPSARFSFCSVDEIVIGGLLGFFYNDHSLIWSLVSNRAYESYQPNDALFNEFIEHSINSKVKRVDFGRTQPIKSYMHFKQKWGSTQAELNSICVKGDSIDKKRFMTLASFVRRFDFMLCNTFIGPHIKRRFP